MALHNNENRNPSPYLRDIRSATIPNNNCFISSTGMHTSMPMFSKQFKKSMIELSVVVVIY